jgi:hypothetical protein
LIAPFPKRYDSPRSYFVIVAPHVVDRPDVTAFVDWLQREATAQTHADNAPVRLIRPTSKARSPGRRAEK